MPGMWNAMRLEKFRSLFDEPLQTRGRPEIVVQSVRCANSRAHQTIEEEFGQANAFANAVVLSTDQNVR